MQNLVILDFGSNSTRLSINEVQANASTFKEVFRTKEMTRMAEGMGQEKDRQLQPQAIERTLEAVRKFKEIYSQYENVKIKAIATAAVRAASNAQEFIDQVKQITGATIEVLSGDTEAYYDYVGVTHYLNLKDAIIVDMGGGSFEVILMKDGKDEHLISIQHGAVSLSEKFNAHDKILVKDLFEFQNYLQALFDEKLSWLKDGHDLPLVLLGGATRTVARKKIGTLHTEEKSIHELKIMRDEIFTIYQNWLAMNKQERKQDLGSEASRADIIIGGLTPIIEIMRRCHCPYVTFSESGVREGLLFEMLETNSN